MGEAAAGAPGADGHALGVRAVAVGVDIGLNEAPEREAEQPDDNQPQQDAAEGLG